MIINNEEEMIELGYKIGKVLKKGDILLLEGDLSAGKTTLTKGIGKALGIKKIINSPTYVIMKEYQGDINLYHLDFYRLKEEDNDYDILDFIKDGITVIEWPSMKMDLVLDKYYLIKFKIDGTKRILDLGELNEKISVGYFR